MTDIEFRNITLDLPDGTRVLDDVSLAVPSGERLVVCGPPRAGKTTVPEYAKRWRAAKVWRDRPASRVESNMRLHILPLFGDRTMASLALSSARAVYTSRRSMFKAAVDDRVIAVSPCSGVKAPAARET